VLGIAAIVAIGLALNVFLHSQSRRAARTTTAIDPSQSAR
jgi:hypothetical protein